MKSAGNLSIPVTRAIQQNLFPMKSDFALTTNQGNRWRSHVGWPSIIQAKSIPGQFEDANRKNPKKRYIFLKV